MTGVWGPRLAVLAAAALWSLTGPHARVAYAWGLTPLDAVLWRAGSAWAVLAAWRALRGSLSVPQRPPWALVALQGAVGVGAFYLLYFCSLRLNPLPVAAVLLYSAPAFVALAEWVGEGARPGPRRAGALIMALAGVYLVSGPVRDAVTPTGLWIGLGSGMTYAAYIVLGRRLAARAAPQDVLLGSLGTGTALLALAAWLAPTPAFRYGWTVVAWLVGGGLLLTLLPYGLLLWALRRLPAGEASLLATVEPVLAVTWAWALLAEVPTATQALGAALVVAAAASLAGEERVEERAPPAREG